MAQAAESQQWLPPSSGRKVTVQTFALDSPFQHRDFHAHASLTNEDEGIELPRQYVVDAIDHRPKLKINSISSSSATVPGNCERRYQDRNPYQPGQAPHPDYFHHEKGTDDLWLASSEDRKMTKVSSPKEARKKYHKKLLVGPSPLVISKFFAVFSSTPSWSVRLHLRRA